MRNLKKVLSLIVVVAMLLTAMVPAFAAGSASISADAKACAEIGMLLGDGSGVTEEYTATSLTRVQAAVLLLRLKGVSEEAANYTGTDNFEDVDADAWFAPYTAYLKAHPEFGFIGDGVNFNAEEKISAQQYYKVILTALGYEEGEGKDYVYADTLTFAASKGLVKVTGDELTVDDLAVATVEGLKATVKDSTKTLATTLVEAGKINADKAEIAGVYTKLTQGFDVTYGARSITVKFNMEPADASKVAIKLTRDAGLAVAATFTQDTEDKTVFKYTANSSLTLGDYTVSVKDDAADLGSKTITVEEEKLKSIEITSSQIIRKSDTEGYLKYRAYNNYGEDVTKEAIAANIDWTISLPSGNEMTASKGTIDIEYGSENDTSYLARLRDYTTTPIVVSGYDKDSAVTVTKSLYVSTTVGDIASIKLLGVSNIDGLTTIYRNDSTNVFYVDYEIKDSNGELITDYDLLSSGDAVRVYPEYTDETDLDDVNIAVIEIVRDPESTDDAKFQIRLKTGIDEDNQYDGVGTLPVNAIAVQTGKTANLNVEVKAGLDELASFVLQRPDTSVTESSGWIEIPYLAYDAAGNPLTSYTKINPWLELSPSDKTKLRTTYDSTGAFKLYFNASAYTKDNTVTLTATVQRNFKYSNINLTIKKAVKPDEIVATNFDTVNFTKDAFYDFDLSKFTVEDENGNAVNLMNDEAEYYIEAVPTDANIVGIKGGNNRAIGDKKIYLVGGTKTGSTTVQFKLWGPGGYTETNNQLVRNADKLISTKSVTFRNVESKDITSYGIETIGKLYEVYDSDLDRVDNTTAKSNLKNAYRSEIKIRGYLSNGQKVYLGYAPNAVSAAADTTTYKTAMIVQDSLNVVDSDYEVFPDSNGKTYIYAIPSANNDDDSSSTLSAVIMVDGTPRNVSTTLTSSETTTPIASKITAIANKAYLKTNYTDLNSSVVTTAGSTYYVAPLKDKGGDFFEINTEDFDLAFGTVTLTEKNALGNNVTNTYNKLLTNFATGVINTAPGFGSDGAQYRAGLYFLVTDSYGKEGIVPDLVVLSSASTYYDYAISGGVLTRTQKASVTTLPDGAGSGDEIRIMASKNGISKTVTIQIK